jgi:hypothetical protein
MTFEEWLRDLDYPDNDPLNIAECAWNAAITEAAMTQASHGFTLMKYYS